MSQSLKKYHETIGVIKSKVIILKTAIEEEAKFFSTAMVALVMLGLILLVSSDTGKKINFFFKYSKKKLIRLFNLFIISGKSFIKLTVCANRIGIIKKVNTAVK